MLIRNIQIYWENRGFNFDPHYENFKNTMNWKQCQIELR
ncbi:hypothetical protein KR51_00008280 [Rubidibacter lacunae KORDI 51-2]|uniref:Uncharacterized protein n=1 Tax=Rubidibacter lacunae KORDI 51-2 TaxID=582515 RepID=U5DS50_9CHRO|nr:hypothetical protein KR51_00008280 [Rubidibacter lacunae KORDI 51-2]